MREGGVYSGGAVEKGGDANVAERKLTERQKEFCRLCAAGMKPMDVARMLGYKNIGRSVGAMLRQERIQREIQRLQAKQDEPTEKMVQKAEEEDTPAEKAEILSFLTEVMRDNAEADLKTRMKAAELLGKRESLFEKGKGPEEKCRVVIVDTIFGGMTAERTVDI